MRFGGGPAASVLAALALACAAAPASAQVSADELLFIHGDGQPPMTLVQSGDQALIDRFTAQGFVVRVRRDDDGGMVQDAQSAAIIYISETVASGNVIQTFAGGGVTLRTYPRPILCAEPYLYDDLRMTGLDSFRTTPDTAAQNGGIDNGDWGNLPNHDRLNIVDAAHPLAAGLGPGVVTFSTAPVAMGFGMPGPGAQVVARCDPAHPWSQQQAPSPPLAQRAVIFVYEQGAALWDGSVAPARRVGLQGRHGAANGFNGDGWSVLDGAVSYTGGLKRISAGSAWTNAAAWSPPGLPTSTDSVLVVGNGTVTAATNAAVRRLTVSAGATLDVTGGALAVSEDAVVRGALLARGGVTRLLGASTVLAGGRLEVRGGVVRLGAATCTIEGALVTAGGTIEGDGAARADLRVTTGTLSADGLTFRNGDAEGLHVQAGATIARLRAVAFGGVAPGAGSRLLTIEQPTLNLNAPGCTFEAVASNQSNVRLVDTNTGTAGDVVLNLEQRSTSGAGAGPAREAEVGGAAINWVHAAPDTTSGVATGFAQTAWDLDTFADFACYAPFRDVDGAGTDRIYVLDPDGDGVDLGYRFDVPASRGDIVGYPWWDKIGAQRVLWVVTTGGWVLRYLDQGASSSPNPVVAVQIAQSGSVTFTTPPITDSSYVFAAGVDGAGQPRLFAMRVADGTLAWSLALAHPITSELATEVQDGVTKVFAGGQTAGGGTTAIIDQTFSSGGNTAPFSFQRGLFSPSGNGGDETGTVTGGAIRVRLRNDNDLSAGYRATFNVTGAPVRVDVSFRYRLFFDGAFDTNEEGRCLCAVDGALQGVGGDPWLARFVGTTFPSWDDQDSGWQSHSFSLVLPDGSHTLDLGGTVNNSDQDAEFAYMYFDDVLVQAVYSSGIVYRIDTQTRLVDADNRSAAGAVVAAPYPAFGIGLFVGDQTGRVLGIDHATMNDLSGWPITPDATPVLGNVWLDWQAGRLYWGNEAGRVFGYDASGAALPGFPRTPMGGAAIRGGGIVSDGVLWIGDRDGRLVGLDASSGATLSPDLRFGAGVVVGQVSQGFVGRPMVTTSAGKLVVVHPVTDPTP